MPNAAVIVLERSGGWAAGLRRHLPGAAALAVRETRRAADCLAELAAAPKSLVVVEWSCDRRTELCDLLDRLGRQFPAASVVAVADRQAAGDEFLAREAGAIHFCGSPRSVATVARLAQGYLAQRRDGVLSTTGLQHLLSGAGLPLAGDDWAGIHDSTFTH